MLKLDDLRPSVPRDYNPMGWDLARQQVQLDLCELIERRNRAYDTWLDLDPGPAVLKPLLHEDNEAKVRLERNHVRLVFAPGEKPNFLVKCFLRAHAELEAHFDLRVGRFYMSRTIQL